MNAIPLLQCTLDLSQPVEEIVEVIATVLKAHPSNAVDIVHALDLRVAEMRVELDEVDN